MLIAQKTKIKERKNFNKKVKEKIQLKPITKKTKINEIKKLKK